ncbi:MAG: right-handed parallel beta-helix repeat-containing protein [Sphingobium sp.]
MGKGALVAILLFFAPSAAAVFYAGHRSDAERAVDEWASSAFAGKSDGQAGSGGSASSGRKGVSVSSAEQLTRALETAQDGDAIGLMPGRYPGIVISNIKKNGNVAITSADPSRPAIIEELLIRNSAGLTLSNVELAANTATLQKMKQNSNLAGDPSAPVQPRRAFRFLFIVTQSERIGLDRLNVHGPADDADTAQFVRPLIVRDSREVTVSNSRFSHMQHGLEMLNLDGFRVINNEYSDLRTDGVRGGDSSNVEIAGNIFTDFRPAPGDHPDGIQLWSTPRGTKLTNISIHDNLIVQGNGGTAQGIFLRDVKNNFAFQNVEIKDNLIIGGLYNAVAINSVQGGKIAGNRIVEGPDIKRARVRIDNSMDIEMHDNSAPNYVVTRSQVDKSDNKINGQSSKKSAGLVADWLDAKQGRRRSDSALQVRLSGDRGL